MKKICCSFVLFVILGVFSSLAFAENRNVSIQFTYSGPEASEFRLYCNGFPEPVHVIPYGATDSNFVMNIVENDLEFILSAVVDGLEYLSDTYPVEVVKKMQDFKIGAVLGVIKIKYS